MMQFLWRRVEETVVCPKVVSVQKLSRNFKCKTNTVCVTCDLKPLWVHSKRNCWERRHCWERQKGGKVLIGLPLSFIAKWNTSKISEMRLTVFQAFYSAFKHRLYSWHLLCNAIFCKNSTIFNHTANLLLFVPSVGYFEELSSALSIVVNYHIPPGIWKLPYCTFAKKKV